MESDEWAQLGATVDWCSRSRKAWLRKHLHEFYSKFVHQSDRHDQRYLVLRFALRRYNQTKVPLVETLAEKYCDTGQELIRELYTSLCFMRVKKSSM